MKLNTFLQKWGFQRCHSRVHRSLLPTDLLLSSWTHANMTHSWFPTEPCNSHHVRRSLSRGDRFQPFFAFSQAHTQTRAQRSGRRCEKQGYLLTQPLQCRVNNLLLLLLLATTSESEEPNLQPETRGSFIA